MHRALLLLLASIITVACGETTPAPSTAPTSTPSSPPSSPPIADPTEKQGSFVTCTKDEDCPSPACGPCSAGEVLTKEQMTAECVVNPCPNAKTGCDGKHVCVVR